MSGTLIFPANYDAYQAGIGNPGMTGAAHSVSADCEPKDIVAALRAVVEEVTGKPLPAVAPNKIGFY